MSTFSMTNKTSSKIKEVSLGLILTCSLIGATFSTSVNATPVTSVEDAVSDFVIAQGERIIAELNKQLQQSIDKEIKNFSANFSSNSELTWLTAEKQAVQATPSVSITKTNQ